MTTVDLIGTTICKENKMDIYRTYTNFQNQLTVILVISVLHIQINMNACMLQYHIPLFFTPPLILFTILLPGWKRYDLFVDIFNIAAGGLVMLILKPNTWLGALEYCSQTVYDSPYTLSFLLGDIMVFGTFLKLFIYYIESNEIKKAFALFLVSTVIGAGYVALIEVVVYPE